jgi:hypothetical protein
LKREITTNEPLLYFEVFENEQDFSYKDFVSKKSEQKDLIIKPKMSTYLN